MSSSLKNVVVLGASGNIGKPVVAALLADGSFTVTAVARHESKATFPAGVKVVKSDFSPESLVEAFKGQDALVSAVNAMGEDQEVKFIDAALKAGIKRMITNDFGADVENPNMVAAVPFMQAKVNNVEYIRSKQDQGLSWTGVVTGMFTEYGIGKGLIGFDLQGRKAIIYDSGDVKSTTTTYPNIGRSIVGILRNPKETANRYVYVSSFVVTQNELLAVIEKVVGEKFAVEHSTTKQLQKEGLEALPTFKMPEVTKLLVYGIWGPGNGGDYALRKNDSELLGLEKEDLETVIRGIYEDSQKQ